MKQLSQQQGQVLLRLARQVIEKQVGLPSSSPDPAEISDPVFQEKRGVFVTLHKRKKLRGCIGSLVGIESILDGIKRHAINAAFHDHRFDQVQAEEVNELHIEVSVLTTPQLLQYQTGDELLKAVRPGIDGVILKTEQGAGATFLPQVWKQLPNPEQFFSQLCFKAGLAKNYWQENRPEIQIYQVQLFEEPVQ